MQPLKDDFDDLDREEFDVVLDIIDERDPLTLITGAAGTGKSTLVRYMRHHFSRPDTRRNMVVLAPTGVAALNAGGETIHSFFRFKPAPAMSFLDQIRPQRSRESVFGHIDLLVIDEISMVRADLFDAMEKAMRVQRRSKQFFGGVQVALVGDMLQLSPVIEARESEFFGPGGRYASAFWSGAECMRGLSLREVLLEKSFRQTDADFARLLRAIRMQDQLAEALAEINARCCRPPDGDEDGVTLVTTNRAADRINAQRLERLPGAAMSYEAEVSGVFERASRSGGAPRSLTLKIGAQVMMVRNDANRRWANGNLAEVVDLEASHVVVQLADSDVPYRVEPETWEAYRYDYDAEQRCIASTLDGSYRQLPMMLAWGATIHKCQGVTLDRMALDLGGGTFAHGQAYVALSRCRTLDGLRLIRPLAPQHLQQDMEMLRYYQDLSGDPQAPE